MPGIVFNRDSAFEEDGQPTRLRVSKAVDVKTLDRGVWERVKFNSDPFYSSRVQLFHAAKQTRTRLRSRPCHS